MEVPANTTGYCSRRLAAFLALSHAQLLERIGGGSTARVYRGTLDGVSVAIKVLHPHAAQRDAPLRDFLREALLMSRLKHGNLIQLMALAHLPPHFGGLPTRRFTWGIITELMQVGGFRACVFARVLVCVCGC